MAVAIPFAFFSRTSGENEQGPFVARLGRTQRPRLADLLPSSALQNIRPAQCRSASLASSRSVLMRACCCVLHSQRSLASSALLRLRTVRFAYLAKALSLLSGSPITLFFVSCLLPINAIHISPSLLSTSPGDQHGTAPSVTRRVAGPPPGRPHPPPLLRLLLWPVDDAARPPLPHPPPPSPPPCGGHFRRSLCQTCCAGPRTTKVAAAISAGRPVPCPPRRSQPPPQQHTPQDPADDRPHAAGCPPFCSRRQKERGPDVGVAPPQYLLRQGPLPCGRGP